jgi:hypothetical protein
MDQIFPFRIDDRDLLRDSGFRLFKPQTSFVFCCFYPERRIWRCVAPTDRRLRCFLGLRAPGKSNIKSRLPSVFFTRSCRSIDVRPLQSTTLLLLRDFDPFNQIDDPSSPFLINDRELLRVFGIFPPSLSSRALDLASCVHLNRTTETYSGPSGFGCFSWRYTLCNSETLNTRGPLI